MRISKTSIVSISLALIATSLYVIWKKDHPAESSASSGPIPIIQLSPDDRPFLTPEMAELTPQEIAAFVASENRSASSLIAAWDLTADSDWLDQAAAEHPDDPKVALAMLARGDSEDSEKWIATLIENDPTNTTGYLYEARAALASGDLPSALEALTTMGTASRSDFFMESSRSALTAAFRHAGRSDTEAQILGFSMTKVPAAEMRHLSREIADAITAAHIDGDDGLARSLGEAGMAAAAATVSDDGNGLLITRLVGISMQKNILRQLDEFQLIPGSDELVIERIEALENEIAGIKEAVRGSADILATVNETEISQYLKIVGTEGEQSAMEWLAIQRGTTGG